MNTIGWNFPAIENGGYTGLNNAGIQIFKGSPITSFAREVCQNSLDARLNIDKPVVVEFSQFNLDTNNPNLNLNELKNTFLYCYKFWKGKNSETEDFLIKGIHHLNQEIIPILRVSDFNTTGLEGSDEDFNSSWSNLVKSTGISNKSVESGGSFGIGKSAAFACSNLYTIIYNTLDRNNIRAFQGVAELVSYPINEEKGHNFFNKKKKTLTTTGTGYLGDKTNNEALHQEINLDPNFKRTTPGTDIFILDFIDTKNFEDQIIIAVLEQFLISIYNNELKVKINSNIISRETLKNYIEKYQDKAKKAYNYYQVLNSNDTEEFSFDFEGLGNVNLKVLFEKDLHRNVLMTRKNGMKIFDLKNFPKALIFAGICTLEGQNVNRIFRDMENPSHDKWEPERSKNKTQAKKLNSSLRKEIKKRVLSVSKTIKLEEMDAQGVGEFLPDRLDDENSFSQNSKTGNDSSNILDIEIEKKEPIIKGKEDQKSQSNFENAEKLGRVFSNEKKKNKKKNKNSNLLIDFIENKEISEDDFKKCLQLHKEITVDNIRVIKLNQNKDYRLILDFNNSYLSSYLQFSYSGEINRSRVFLEKAMNLNSKNNYLVKQDKLILGKINKGKIIIDFTTRSFFECPMEIKVYGLSE